MGRDSRVRVHFNLHKKNYTISEYIKGVGWRKCGESDWICLQDVTFKVSEAGRNRAIRQGKRNVHAYAYGYMNEWPSEAPMFAGLQVKYNPFKAPSFMTEFQEPIYKAEEVLFSTKFGVQAWGVVH